MEFITQTLSNGIRVIHQPRAGEVAHCGLQINAGTRDERSDEFGLAHFLEHCLFKGTAKRKAFHVLNRLDSVGGELNAYTSKEDTVIHASFLDHHFERALELLADITFSPSFPEKEVAKEKLIVIDEIHSYLDSPGESIFDEFEEAMYAGHELGHNILGTAENLKRFKPDHLRAFHNRLYVPNSIVFSSVGNIKPEKVMRLAEKYIGSVGTSENTLQRTPFTPQAAFHREEQRDVYQAHYMLGSLAYAQTDDRRRALILLNNILGGPAMNSRLNLNISEKYGFAYNLDSSYHAYSDTGLFTVYLGTEKRYLPKARTLIYKELNKLRNQKLGTLQLHQAKQQLIGQIALSQESGASQMIALGKSLLAFDRVDTIEAIYQEIDSLTAEQLLEVANEVFHPDHLSSLTYMPKPD